MGTALGELFADLDDPVINRYFLADDGFKKSLAKAYEFAKREKQACESIRAKFDAVACRKPTILRPSAVRDVALLNLYYPEGQQPEGWDEKERMIDTWNAGSTTLALDGEDDHLVAYIPQKGTQDWHSLNSECQKLFNERREYSELANLYVSGGEPGRKDVWRDIMWISQFGFPTDEFGHINNRPTLYSLGKLKQDYALNFSVRQSSVSEGQSMLSDEFLSQVIPIRKRTFNALTDKNSKTSIDWRLEQIRRGRSGLSMGDRASLRYVA